jgi:hypothetical protein
MPRPRSPGNTHEPAILAYFVYHPWRLLPRGDVRRYIRPGQLRVLEIETGRAEARGAGVLPDSGDATVRLADLAARFPLAGPVVDQAAQRLEPADLDRHDARYPVTIILRAAKSP